MVWQVCPTQGEREHAHGYYGQLFPRLGKGGQGWGRYGEIPLADGTGKLERIGRDKALVPDQLPSAPDTAPGSPSVSNAATLMETQ